MSERSPAEALIGTWKQQSGTVEEVGAGVSKSGLSAAPNGYVNFAPDGRILLLTVDSSRQKPSVHPPTAAEAEALFRSLIAYAGTYTVEGDKVTYDLDVTWNEAWTGTKQVRFWKIDGDTLTISTPEIVSPMTGKRSIHRLTFKKVPGRGSGPMTSEVTLDVGGSRMNVLLARPTTPGPHPAVVLMHHRGGLDNFTRRTAERLAANGFVAAAPNVYHRRPLGEDTGASRQAMKDGELVADIDAVVAHLRADPGVRADAIAIMGHCAGGRMSYLGAASIQHFKAAVVLYGGGILRGEGEGRPAPLELTKNIRGPVLGLFGKDDTNPSPADTARISAELTRHNIRHEFRSYDGAGHAFQNFDDAGRYRKEQAEDAWTRLLGFLRKELAA